MGVSRRPHTTSVKFLLPLLAAALPVHAVLVAQGDGTQNLSAPTDDFGWANVGTVFDPSEGINITGVYLGSGWVLTAYHGVRDATQTGFQFGPIVFGGVPYTAEAGSGVRLTTPGVGPADLALVHLTSEPPLPSVTIASTDPTNNLSATLMGNGPNRDPNQTHWIVNTLTEPDTWTETALTGNAQGYKWIAGQSLRWGTNNISAFSGSVTTNNFDDGFGTVTAFRTNFTNLSGEAQGGFGDSGGGVFWKTGGQWQLGGIMLFTGGLNGQPANTAVFNDETYAANLATYRTEITSIVPEPSAAALALLGVTGLIRRRARR